MTVTPQPMTATPNLETVLDRLRLEGAIFLRACFTESWAYESPPAGMATVLRPGAERLVLFHLVAEGRCWISLPEGERHWAEAGDVIVLPYGDQHRVGGEVPTDELTLMVDIMSSPPWDEMPVLSFGGGGKPTSIVCGYLHCDDPLFDPRYGAFPPVFVARPPDEATRGWVASSISYALEMAEHRQPTPVRTRLTELLLAEVIRLQLASAPAVDNGWASSFHDPVLAPALAALHAEPERKWTVADLASAASVSRSILDDRFRKVLRRSPIRYLTEWRMHLARELLATTDLTVAAVARRVGYEAEEAFSRAFKRAFGVAPAGWREARRQQA